MNKILIAITIVAVLICIATIIISYIRTKKNYDGLNALLDDAIKDGIVESTYDESRMSALEIKLANFLSASKVSARNVSKEKDEIKTLISDISHQTKTPIANLLLYSELLKEQKLPPEAEGYVDSLLSQTEKLKFLIDSLVKLSRLENGILTLNVRQNNISGLLKKLVEDYTPKASAKGLSLILKEISENETASFDSKWTEEAIGNIIDNAIKYTDTGSVTISAFSTEMFLRIDITDTGRGIAEEDRARVFARFYRSHEVSTEQGVGIGLHLSREIISAEGGYIKVNSEIDKGSTFSVFLPNS